MAIDYFAQEIGNNQAPVATQNQPAQKDYFSEEVGGQQSKPSFMASFARSFMGNAPMEQVKTSEYMADNPNVIPTPKPGENIFDFIKRGQQNLQPREQDLARRGTVAQFEQPINAGLAISGAINPFGTAKALAKFTGLNVGTNLVGLDPNKIQDPNLRDAADIGKTALMGSLSSVKWPGEAKLDANVTGKMTQAQYNELIDKHADIYRNILNPGAPEIRNLDKTGKNVDDAMTLAAQKSLPIAKDAANKLDTTQARDILQEHNETLDQSLSDALKSNPDKIFNLNDIAEQAKKDYRAKTSNDLEYESGAKHIDDQIAAAIKNKGEMVDGATLNDIKRGMWKTSYNQGVPNAQDAARSIGFVTKDAIESAYPEKSIQDINAEMGKNLTLDNLLSKAHGRIVDKGKLGKYFQGLRGSAIGSMVGGGIGTAIGHPWIGAELGAATGGKLGEKFTEWQTDPGRITESLANKLKGIEIINPSVPESTRKGTVTPDVLGVRPNIKTPEGLAIEGNVPLGLTDQSLPEYLKQRYGDPNAIMQPPPDRGGLSINQPLNPSAIGIPYLRTNIRDIGLKPSLPLQPIPNKSGIEQFSVPKEGVNIPLKGDKLANMPRTGDIAHANIPVSNEGQGEGFTFKPGGKFEVSKGVKLYTPNLPTDEPAQRTTPKETPQEVKDKAKEILNQQWQGGLFGNTSSKKGSGSGLGSEKGSAFIGNNSQEFIRNASDIESKSQSAKNKAFNSFPKKEGYQIVYKPYGEQGKGFYYVPETRSGFMGTLGPTMALGLGIGASMFGSGNSQAATLGNKNNNPINLKAFQKWDGMTGKDKYGHAQFKDLDSGIRAAIKNLNNHKMKNPNQSISSYMSTFAEANSSQEANFIAKNMGITPSTKLKDVNMDDFLIHLAKFESKTILTPKDILRVRTKFKLA